VLAGCGRPDPAVVHVLAAASTREPLERLTADFSARTGIPVQLQFGPSSELAWQVELDAPADLFLSADEAWADHVAQAGRQAGRWTLLTNRLVVVVPAAGGPAVTSLADLTGPAVRRLALAGEVVPAGRYGRAGLKAAGVWEAVKGKVVEGGDVRAALAYAARGEADAAVVYATDVVADGRVRVACDLTVPTPVRYPLVLLSPGRPAAARLADFLRGPEGAAAFRSAGFGVAE
jgi:molybdate transport system substrate-binding protein